MYKSKKIAIVGVSENTEKFGYKIFADLFAAGFNVFGVGIKGGEVCGKEIYKTLDDLSQKPDLVITVVPPVVTEKVVEDCIRLGIKEIWMQPGSQSQEAAKKAKAAGIKVTDDACFMVVNGIW